MNNTRHKGFATVGSAYYPTLVAVFTGLVLISNVAATKGIAFGLVGVLLWRAATSADVSTATGLEGAMTAIAGVAAAGPWLLTGIAAGFAAFGVYALVRARYPDRDPSS